MTRDEVRSLVEALTDIQLRNNELLLEFVKRIEAKEETEPALPEEVEEFEGWTKVGENEYTRDVDGARVMLETDGTWRGIVRGLSIYRGETSARTAVEVVDLHLPPHSKPLPLPEGWERWEHVDAEPEFRRRDGARVIRKNYAWTCYGPGAEVSPFASQSSERAMSWLNRNFPRQ